MLEDFALEFAKEKGDVRVVGLRYCNIFGPGENHKGKRATMIYQFAQQMQKGNPKLFEMGEQKRDYIYVKDVVRANLLAAASKENLILNCGSGTATSFNRIVEILNGLLGLNRTPEYMPNPFAGNYQDYTLCDMSLARQKIGFVPQFSIEGAIKDYLQTGSLIAP